MAFRDYHEIVVLFRRDRGTEGLIIVFLGKKHVPLPVPLKAQAPKWDAALPALRLCRLVHGFTLCIARSSWGLLELGAPLRAAPAGSRLWALSAPLRAARIMGSEGGVAAPFSGTQVADGERALCCKRNANILECRGTSRKGDPRYENCRHPGPPAY